jgi:hypothetical protein
MLQGLVKPLHCHRISLFLNHFYGYRKPGCRRIVEWAKKTGRIKGSEMQELLDFARKTIEAAEKNGDIIEPVSDDGGENEDENKKAAKNAPDSKSAALVGNQIISP